MIANDAMAARCELDRAIAGWGAQQANQTHVCEVLQEQRIPGALETHMQFADLTLSKGEEADIGMPQSLVDSGNIFLIATNAIRSLSNDIIHSWPD